MEIPVACRATREKATVTWTRAGCPRCRSKALRRLTVLRLRQEIFYAARGHPGPFFLCRFAGLNGVRRFRSTSRRERMREPDARRFNCAEAQPRYADR